MFLEPYIDKEIDIKIDDAELTWRIGRLTNSVAQSSIDRFVDIEKLMTQSDDTAALVQGIGFIATYTPPSVIKQNKGFGIILRPTIEDDDLVIGHNLETHFVDTLAGEIIIRQQFVSDYYGGIAEKKRWLRDIEERMPSISKRATYIMLEKIAKSKDKYALTPPDGPTLWAMFDRKEKQYTAPHGLEGIEPFTFGGLEQAEEFTRWISAAADTSELDGNDLAVGKIHFIDGDEYALVTSLYRENNDILAQQPQFARRDRGCWTLITDEEETRLSMSVIRYGTEVSSHHAAGILNELHDDQDELQAEVLLDTLDDVGDDNLGLD